MHEHPFVTVAKFGLMVLILLFLIFLFAAHNDTQEKVIATRQYQHGGKVMGDLGWQVGAWLRSSGSVPAA